MRQPSGVPFGGWSSSSGAEAGGRTAVATNIAGPRAPGSTPASCQRSPVRPAWANSASIAGRPKPSQTWPMVRRYSSYGWGRTSAITSRPPGRSTRATSASAADGSATWCRRWTTSARSSDSAVERQRPRCGPRRPARCRSRPGASAPRRASRATSRRPPPSARTARAPRRCGRSRSRGRRPRRSGSSSAGRSCRSLVSPNSSPRSAVPLVGDVGEERLGVALAAALQHLLAPAQVEADGERLGEALVHELPEPARALVEPVDRERVDAARAVAARVDPARVGELLEVARDGGLRQRERVAELDDGHLDAVEARQHAPARGVGEQTELPEEGRRGVQSGEAGGSFHPSIRIIAISSAELQGSAAYQVSRAGNPGARRSTPSSSSSSFTTWLDQAAPPYSSRARRNVASTRRGELERHLELAPQIEREAEILDREIHREADVVRAVEDHLALGLVHERVARARADHLVGRRERDPAALARA